MASTVSRSGVLLAIRSVVCSASSRIGLMAMVRTRRIARVSC